MTSLEQASSLFNSATYMQCCTVPWTLFHENVLTCLPVVEMHTIDRHSGNFQVFFITNNSLWNFIVHIFMYLQGKFLELLICLQLLLNFKMRYAHFKFWYRPYIWFVHHHEIAQVAKYLKEDYLQIVHYLSGT